MKPVRAAFQLFLFLSILFSATSCQTIRNKFAQLTTSWEAKSGQLLYRSRKTTIIGEVLVRYTKAGDFELTFTKGPGVPLLFIQQNAEFARVRGPIAGVTWSGPVKRAPQRLRGWLELRELVMQSSEPVLKHSFGSETFIFEF